MSRHTPFERTCRAGWLGAICGGAAVCVAAWCGPASAQAILPTGFTDQLITGGLSYSASMAFLPDGRVLVTEKYDARLRLVVNGALVAQPVAVIDSVRQSSESGLLGVAVDPGWPDRPYVYLHYNYLGSRSIRVARYTAVGDVAFAGSGAFTLDAASRYIVLADLPDDYDYHNGGTLRFGPDSMLYVALGDDLINCFAVLKNRLQGKILRLDVSQLPNGPGGPPARSAVTPADNPFVADPSADARLVWAYGLRNPYCFQIDEPTGDLFIADVGSDTWEELDRANAAGMNFGWPTYEGPVSTGSNCPFQEPLTATPPIYAYDRSEFLHGAAIITSPRYRRPVSGANRFPADYDGDIFVSDVGEGFLRRLTFNGSFWQVAPPVPGQPADSDWAQNMDGVTDYALRPDGSLWYLKYSEGFQNTTGQVRRIIFDNALAVRDADPDGGVGLAPPYPSPTTTRVTLRFVTARAGPVRLSMFDIAGRELRRLADAALPAASYTREWDLLDPEGREVPPGIYLAVLEASGRRAVRPLIVVR